MNHTHASALAFFFLYALSHAAFAAEESRTECLIVQDARLKLKPIPTRVLGSNDPEAVVQGYLEIANFGHSVEKGRSSVLIIRRFEGSDELVDSHEFMKITAEFPRRIHLNKITSPVYFDALRSYYAFGSVGFIYRGDYWRGVDPIKRIQLTPSGEGGFLLHVDEPFFAQFIADGRTERRKVELNCPLVSRKLSTLGAWEGYGLTSWKSFGPLHQKDE